MGGVAAEKEKKRKKERNYFENGTAQIIARAQIMTRSSEIIQPNLRACGTAAAISAPSASRFSSRKRSSAARNQRAAPIATASARLECADTLAAPAAPPPPAPCSVDSADDAISEARRMKRKLPVPRGAAVQSCSASMLISSSRAGCRVGFSIFQGNPWRKVGESHVDTKFGLERRPNR